ncbi:hypothetical protein PUN28_016316 [Cardiocondyla obscurior]|uniref:Transmembrane protein 218 n=1 Tax=Cardiocondyla obscurior TaxID=286306 RepID=A0AAW2ET66_9HYME
MTTLILGVGVGLFLILSLWVLAALIFVVTLRVERRFGYFAILLASAVTIVLISVPRASENPIPASKVYDRLFIWRVILLILLLASSVLSLVGYIKFGLVEPVRPIRVPSWVYTML